MAEAERRVTAEFDTKIACERRTGMKRTTHHNLINRTKQPLKPGKTGYLKREPLSSTCSPRIQVRSPFENNNNNKSLKTTKAFHHNADLLYLRTSDRSAHQPNSFRHLKIPGPSGSHFNIPFRCGVMFLWTLQLPTRQCDMH